jgi:hypothetical protein
MQLFWFAQRLGLRHELRMRFALACLWLWPIALLGGDLPPAVLPDGIGVNIHFARGHQRDVDLIAAAGFRFIRTDFIWESIEHQKGQYDWSDYDGLTTDLEQRGLRAIYILDYSNPLYETFVAATNPMTGQLDPAALASPQHPDSVAAFARFAAAAAEHFRGRRVIWEIWNEPNISFWKPLPNARQYADVAMATGRAIRAADPDATIIGPASSSFPWEFIETLFQAGALEYLDAVSVHPYRRPDQSPETAKVDFDKLNKLIDRYAPPARRGHIPIISGEWGYSSCTGGVSPEIQAAFLVRQQLANLMNGIPLSIWYDWKNDGPDPKENEHNFGTVQSDLSPKPAYQALTVMTAQLATFRIERRLPAVSSTDYVLLLKNDKGQTRLAAWTTEKAHEVALPMNRKKGAVIWVDGHGASSPSTIENGVLTIPLSELPVYVNPGKLKIKEQTL